MEVCGRERGHLAAHAGVEQSKITPTSTKPHADKLKARTKHFFRTMNRKEREPGKTKAPD